LLQHYLSTNVSIVAIECWMLAWSIRPKRFD